MRVSDIQIHSGDAYCQLQGWVESDADPDGPAWFEPFLLWYRFPPWCEPFLSPDNGDPFLAALLVPAMREGERLALTAPVSPRLLDALPEIVAIYAAFDSRNHPIPIAAGARAETPSSAGVPPAASGGDPGVGLFFSMGVDSFYCLLKNARDHPADTRTVTHLLSVHGFDVAFDGWDERFPPPLLNNFQRVATETGKTLVPVVTNLRRVATRLAPWPMAHGGGTISVALALGAMLRRVHIAASTTYDKLYPWGSHPLLDPLWSTETLTVIHDGCELNTIDKTAVIAGSPLVLETLRPCAGYGSGYNCGQCLKCLRTMIDLLMAGSLGRCQTLPHQIDPERLRRALRPGGPVHVADFRRRLEALSAIGEAPAVCEVLAEHLAQGMAGKWTADAGTASGRGAQRPWLLARLLRRGRR